jgi:hypothetical protein
VLRGLREMEAQREKRAELEAERAARGQEMLDHEEVWHMRHHALPRGVSGSLEKFSAV